MMYSVIKVLAISALFIVYVFGHRQYCEIRNAAKQRKQNQQGVGENGNNI